MPPNLSYVGHMRTSLVWAVGLLVVLALPTSALGATPRWPSATDVRTATPSLSAKDATCIASYYHGRLSGKAWFTPYYKLTPAQKVVTDAGFARCMTLNERRALVQRQGVIDWGKQPTLQCVARLMVARTPAQLRALTSLGAEIRSDDRIYRSCGLMGAVYTSVAKSTQLSLTKAERTCVNKVGSADPIRPRASAPTAAQRKAIGTVFDRCVGRASELTMWQRLLKSYSPAAAIPCIARHSLTIKFTTVFADRTGLEAQAQQAVNACLVTSTS